MINSWHEATHHLRYQYIPYASGIFKTKPETLSTTQCNNTHNRYPGTVLLVPSIPAGGCPGFNPTSNLYVTYPRTKPAEPESRDGMTPKRYWLYILYYHIQLSSITVNPILTLNPRPALHCPPHLGSSLERPPAQRLGKLCKLGESCGLFYGFRV